MNDFDLVNLINSSICNDNIDAIIKELNNLFDTGEYKKHLNIVYMAISVTQMYVFLSYFDDNEIKQFLSWDTYRATSYTGNRIKFYNSGQLSLVLELEKNKKIFLSAPTSFGKTSLVIEYILNNYKKLQNVLFIVPTNSLLEELYWKIVNLNDKFKMDYNVSTLPKLSAKGKNFLILTPERFLLMSEKNSICIFNLILMDEVYKIVDFNEKKISDFVENRSLRFRKVADMIGSSNNKVILLSPFTYEETDSMKRYLDKYKIKRINRQIEYVSRRIIDVTTANKFKENFGSKTIHSSYNNRKEYKVCSLLSALENEKNIVYVSAFNMAYAISNEFNGNLIKNRNDRYDFFMKHLYENYSIDDKTEWTIISALKKGIGIYIAPLPRYIKAEIISLYNENVLGTLIVTTAFTEGVNTNASNLIFTSLTNGHKSNKLTEIDILNVAGRAGRFASKSVGRVYCIDKKVLNQVNIAQNNANIKLENYNYMLDKQDEPRIDYEIEMMENIYLKEPEISQKEELDKEIKMLGLTNVDLNISLNVSNKWKVQLYRYFDNVNIEEAYNACKNIFSNQNDKRVYSMEYIFRIIKQAFESNNITVFPCKNFDIKAFSYNNKFIWGRLYRIYSRGKISEIIKTNKKYINDKLESIINTYNLSGSIDEIKNGINYYQYSWILKYLNDDLTININNLYSETFKFISSVIKYKIPFYLSFFVSIFKLYLEKNEIINKYDMSILDTEKVVLLFEDGYIDDSLHKLIDFGIPSDTILKIVENKITLENIKSDLKSINIFDEYEKILLNQISNFI